MVYYTYILKKPKTGKYYCGQTNNVHSRLGRHNDAQVKSTKNGIPWTLIYFKEVASRTEAMALEKQIKGRGIQRWLNSQ